MTISISRSIRLVAFDLDGTLIDSIGDIAASANHFLVETYGEGARLSQDVVRSFVGNGARHLIERCVEAAGHPREDMARRFERFLEIYRSHLTDTTRLYDGMKDALDELSATCDLAILTNKPGDMSRSIVRDLGLSSFFRTVIGGDDLKTRKPDPEGLLKIIAAAGVRADETAMVGDSAVDIATARNAGALDVGVSWGYDREGVEREKPAMMLRHPADLTKALFAASPPARRT